MLVTQRLSNEALYLELASDPHALAAGGIQAVYRTGDCVAPRWLVDTVFDGHRLAREIDSPNPHVYLPTAARAGHPGLTAGSAHVAEAPRTGSASVIVVSQWR